MKHIRTEMVERGTTRQISKPTPHFRSGKGIWLRKMVCPVCSDQKSPPRNLGDDRKYYCEGKPDKDQDEFLLGLDNPDADPHEQKRRAHELGITNEMIDAHRAKKQEAVNF